MPPKKMPPLDGGVGVNRLLTKLEGRRRRLRSGRGFSLVELAVVIVVIGILVAIAVPIFSGMQSSAVEAVVKTAASNGARVVSEEIAVGKPVIAPLMSSRTAFARGAGGGSTIAAMSLSASEERPLAERLQALAEAPVTEVKLILPEAGLVTSDNFCVQATDGKHPQTAGPGCAGADGDDGGGPVEPEVPAKRSYVVTLDSTLPNCFAPGVNVGAQPDSEFEVEWQGKTVKLGPSYVLTRPVEPGEFQVKITGEGELKFIPYMAANTMNCLKSVDQWDDGLMTSAVEAFKGAGNLETVAEFPKGITNTKSMFFQAVKFNSPVNHWDMSAVTDTSYMFSGARSFNQPLDKWDVSQVTTMDQMFFNAVAFNYPIGNWDVSNVTNMNNMFYNATVFNQPLNDWVIDKVTVTRSMFELAVSFNQPLDKWNVGAVTDMRSMFKTASSFNQDLSGWPVRKGVMKTTFNTASALTTGNLPKWVL